MYKMSSCKQEEISFDKSVIDTSSFCAEDFALFMECLDNIGKATTGKVKKTRKSRSQKQNKQNDVSATSIACKKTMGHDADDVHGKRWAPSHFSSCYNLNDTSSALDPNITCSTINQTINDSSLLAELHLNDVFAYFNEDIDKTRFDESDENVSNVAEAIDSTEHIVDKQAVHSSKEKPPRTIRSKRTIGHNEMKIKEPICSSSESDRESMTFKRPNALPLRRKVITAARQPNGKSEFNNRLNRTMNDMPSATQTARYSSASTVSLNGSDNDSMGKRTTPSNANDVGEPNVREKIIFFNQTLNEDNAQPPASQPATPKDERQCDRQKSKRKFQQTRDFFEKIFRERFNGNKRTNEKNAVTASQNNVDNLDAIKTYAQTQYLLERIRFLVKVISKMNETQLNQINLKRFKKFLMLIRDCAHNCQEVCYEIGENFLTDFEKNVMSVDELLFTALKAANRQEEVY